MILNKNILWLTGLASLVCIFPPPSIPSQILNIYLLISDLLTTFLLQVASKLVIYFPSCHKSDSILCFKFPLHQIYVAAFCY